MPSLIPGYEYDIFISYRQKDNKYDGWVTEFVSNLRKELEATFKEDISIYFDENAHDGLLETHNVDKSLEGKLKSVIFIPIISQTYCDPKSFAWKNEFLAFKNIAKGDAIGLDVALRNGNVSSRILPVRIHDLDPADKQLLENETGPLRSVDFIFRAAGVNRPLRSEEKNESENQNRTHYRNQINKVANACKEIISGIVSPEQRAKTRPYTGITKRTRRVGFYVGLAAFCAIALTLYFLPGNTRPTSVAILPFRNNTGSSHLDYYGIGMASEIRTKLSLTREFDFISSLQATLPYASTDKSPEQIGSELSVDYIISGLYQMSGQKIKVEAELIDAHSGKVVWALPFERDAGDIFMIQAEIANEVLKQLANGKVTGDRTTNNLEAYAHYIRARSLLDHAFGDSVRFDNSYNPVLGELGKAIELDSSFVDAWTELIAIQCFIFMSTDPPDPARKELIEKYYKYFDSHFPDSWQKDLVRGQIAFRVDFEYEKAVGLFEKVLQKNPDNVHATVALASIYRRTFDFPNAMKYASRQINLNPGHGGNWVSLGLLLESMGDSENAFKAYLKGWQLSKSNNFAQGMTYQAVIAGLSTDDLPEELKKADSGYTYWSLSAKRQWKLLKEHCRQMKDTIGLMLTHVAINESDSARLVAASALKADPKFPEFYHAILGDRAKVFEYTSRDPMEGLEEDKQVSVNKILSDIELIVLLGDFKTATQALANLSKKYPEFGNYSRFFNNPMYDKIKREYPDFNKILNAINLKPPNHLTKDLKL